ncbi:MAG: 50S ribosomal protein L10 [Candidatus Kerfeldbacteria bacterium RIFCSPHIGHO2_02_FULL_42_14]|uniref:Large ribosomal subunit protein uL10 n=1 Tax=Candidatus Kerfeldbacteria bacterium RIFCSPHIGHO2_02_FULL_42_14 TaxID=1798540 RepID=A0A1G2AQS4_9BACT|nr:MAG: 50S ribosomal protein L10 [Candidatus Kerfeldbacteria bacterium RIFCSPHIGHO2_02_FULL_42_14]OGY81324.1 MAG: 50S ribosomal protein L10 [Candidatus Kerfeldbacteria bacterium RIFCSPHIGHO2_12_FULL_42_13]OGY83598.1 MAG: 50S ribosomal protein L10 [Candidatus Kerfeldbacteria bacterium RIFCSPLOWO2_02_FULL_42_19]OGY86688.1 MAG: 50S ribosomal protein L10 [Candidatus Kerfeldbacteria bacterium RIFCSPLOWO2_12_FULL_43_9]
MAKTRTEKENIVQSLGKLFKQNAGIVFVAYSRVSVKDMLALRRAVKQSQCGVSAVKKTLLTRALVIAGDTYDVGTLNGSVFVGYGSDQVALAKVIDRFRKEHGENIKMLGGILDHTAVSSEQIMSLAQLPSRMELTAQFVGTLAAPIVGFARVLSGTMQSFVYALSALQKKKAL